MRIGTGTHALEACQTCVRRRLECLTNRYEYLLHFGRFRSINLQRPVACLQTHVRPLN